MKSLKITIASLLILLIGYANISSVCYADLYTNESPKDTDLDGLTDQGEINIFHTDPNNSDTDNDGFLDGTEVIAETNPLDINDPSKTFTPKPPSPSWVWYLTRASGITSYLLLFILLITGTGLTSGYIFKLAGPVKVWRFHRTVGITLIAFIAIHLVTLFLDKFMNFSIKELFIPFYSQFKPLYLSMGIIGFYLFILIIATSIFLIVTKYKAWRFIHYLTFPTFAALFIHGLFIGTDSNTLAMQIVYWTTGITGGLAFIYRLTKIPSRKIQSKENTKIRQEIQKT